MRRLPLVAFALAGCLSAPPAPDGPAHTWTEITDANQPGKLHGADLVFDEKRKRVVLHGGVDGTAAFNATWELSDGDEWRPICAANAPPPLFGPAFGYDRRSEQLVLAGGSTTADLMNPVDTVWTCSSATGLAWVMAGTLPIAVAGAQLVQDRGRDVMALFGGIGPTGTVGGSIYVSPDLTSWQALPIAAPTPFGGSATTATYDRTNERILALKNYTRPFGGSPEATDELWALEKEASHWSLVCGGCSGDPRSEAAIVHTGETGHTYVIGGRGRNGEYAGAWILDNDELIKAFDDPPARDHAAAAYDGDRNVIVVYGGNGPGCAGNCGTTWIMSVE